MGKAKKVIHEIIEKLKNVINNMDIYYRISGDVINNYNMQYRNYQILQNINELNIFNNIFINDINSIINNYDIRHQFNYIINIYSKLNTKKNTNLISVSKSFGFAQKPQPVFKLLRQGSGISPNEQQGIVSTAMTVYQSGITPISNNTVFRIKKVLGGDWIVIVYSQGKPVDFNMTCAQGNDYMYFTLDNIAYQVCRLR